MINFLKFNLGNYFLLLRPYQWPKNLLIYVAIITSQHFTFYNLSSSSIAFFAFCLTASGGYIINDILDIKSDQLHPTKSVRPIAQGIISIKNSFIVAILLYIISFSIALFIEGLLIYFLIYSVLSISYSMFVKKIPWIDCFLLALLYIFRVYIGGIAIDVEISYWLLFFSFFIFTSLSLLKRYSDISLLKYNDKFQRRGYNKKDINKAYIIGSSSGYISSLILALYFFSPRAIEIYNLYIIFFTVPIINLWIWWMWFNAKKNNLYDPLLFIYKDKISLQLGMLFSIIMILAIFFN